jgi:hypothetical protein
MFIGKTQVMSGPISAEDLDTLKRLVRDLEQQRKEDHGKSPA